MSTWLLTHLTDSDTPLVWLHARQGKHQDKLGRSCHKEHRVPAERQTLGKEELRCHMTSVRTKTSECKRVTERVQSCPPREVRGRFQEAVTWRPGLEGEEGASESILPPSQFGSRSVGPAVGWCRDPCWALRGPAPFLAHQPGGQSSSSRQPSAQRQAHQQERGSWGSPSLGHRKWGGGT